MNQTKINRANANRLIIVFSFVLWGLLISLVTYV